MKQCNYHDKCVKGAIEKAEIICDDKGVRLTELRKAVLETIWKQGHNFIKAYDLLDLIKKKDPKAKPTTIYRALDFLIENRLVHKIESKNSFLGCSHPIRQHNCYFLICNKCNSVEEFCEHTAANNIKDLVPDHFKLGHTVLEMYGTCNSCN